MSDTASSLEHAPAFSADEENTSVDDALDGAKIGQATAAVTDSRPSQQRDLPWSDSQEWALRDKIFKYTVRIVVADSMRSFVLWRTMLNDTPELDGYPIPFLIERLEELWDSDTALKRPLQIDLAVLPYLDAFEFETSGGLSGCIYGVQGVADGTRIQTTPVGDVQVTVPKGFVRTADGSVIFELGQPVEQRTDSYSLSGTAATTKPMINLSKPWASSGKELASNLISPQQQQDGGVTIDTELLQLGGLTALVVAGAWAMETLSHHLTVNVFWV
jgi:hypothetical protein